MHKITKFFPYNLCTRLCILTAKNSASFAISRVTFCHTFWSKKLGLGLRHANEGVGAMDEGTSGQNKSFKPRTNKRPNPENKPFTYALSKLGDKSEVIAVFFFGKSP